MRLFAAAALIPLAACSMGWSDDGPGITGTGSGGARSYAAGNFDRIAVKGAGNVEVHVGGAFAVRAEGSPAALDRLRIAVKDDELVIGPRRHGYDGETAPKVYVTLPRLAGTAVAGSGDITVDRVSGGAFKADIAGSGDLKVAAFAVDSVDLSVAGSGDFTGAGTTGTVSVSIAGSGNVKAPDLKARTAKVDIAGGGDVHLNAYDQAKVSIMGGGDVRIDGGATCDVSKMGGGTVTCAHS